MLFSQAALAAYSLARQTNREIAWDFSVPGAAHMLDELKARIQQCANRYLLIVRDEAGLETFHVAAHVA
jgi:fumarate reductase (CoM/CoB) subunit A